jgi:hypothetical protein
MFCVRERCDRVKCKKKKNRKGKEDNKTQILVTLILCIFLYIITLSLWNRGISFRVSVWNVNTITRLNNIDFDRVVVGGGLKLDIRH